MTTSDKAYEILIKELFKIEVSNNNEWTHCETLKEGTKIFTYYVIFNDKQENLTHFNFTVNIKTKKVTKSKKRV
jgi:hypothetical protein